MAVITEIHGYVEEGGSKAKQVYNVEFKAGGEAFFLRNIEADATPGLGLDFHKTHYGVYSLDGDREFKEVLRSRMTDFVLLEEIIEKDEE